MLANGSNKRWWEASDSNGYGYGIADLNLRWTTRLCTAYNYQDYNLSQSGQSLELWGGNPVFSKSSIPTYDAVNDAYFSFGLGTNDVRGNTTTSSTFYTLLLDAIDYAHNTKGWPYSSIVLATINYMEDFANGNLAKQLDYNDKIKQIASLRGTPLIDLYTAFNALSNKSSLLQADHLHLTQDGGHPAVATIFENASYAPYTEVVIIPPIEASLVFYGYKAVIGSAPINPPIGDNVSTINGIFDNTFFFENAKNRQGTQALDKQSVANIPASKGGLTMGLNDLNIVPRTEHTKFNKGYVLLDNENLLFYSTSISTIPFPFEYWFIGVDLSGFPYESYMNVYGMYIGEYGGQLRTTNGNTSNAIFDTASLPLYNPFLVRMRYNANRRVELWIDGVYKGEKDTYYTGSNLFYTNIGIGTDTNNAKWFVGAIAQVNHSLSTQDATDAYNAFKSKYGTEQALAYPIIKNPNVSQSGNTVSATGTYFSPTGVARGTTIYRWYTAGTDAGAPDVTNNVLAPSITTQSFDKSALPAGTWVRADQEVTDVNGLSFKGASGKQYFKIG